MAKAPSILSSKPLTPRSKSVLEESIRIRRDAWFSRLSKTKESGKSDSEAISAVKVL
jgi:hypothetical protein